MEHYRRIYDQEYFELKVLERKGLLQDSLHSLMLGEPNLDRILQLSPYTDIRKEAFSFLEDSLSSVSALRHAFQRDLMDGTLNSFVHDISQRERNSDVYREFYRYFTDENFRRFHGLPLP